MNKHSPPPAAPAVLPSPLARQLCAYGCAVIPPQPALPCNRRDFYKLAFFATGRSQLRQGDQRWDVQGPALICCNQLLTYTWESLDEQAGLFCEFAEEFVTGAERSGSLVPLPLFTLDIKPVLPLTAGQALVVKGYFDQLIAGLESNYAFKYEVSRHQLFLLLHQVRQLLPPPLAAPPASAAHQLAARFLDLLERQFPIHTPTLPLRLRSAQDFAPPLAVHVNYLNRAVRAATGKTTTAHLTERVVQEAQALLRYTDWSITDIAHALGFAYPTYFHNFLKRHTGQTPRQVRASPPQV